MNSQDWNKGLHIFSLQLISLTLYLFPYFIIINDQASKIIPESMHELNTKFSIMDFHMKPELRMHILTSMTNS